MKVQQKQLNPLVVATDKSRSLG